MTLPRNSSAEYFGVREQERCPRFGHRLPFAYLAAPATEPVATGLSAEWVDLFVPTVWMAHFGLAVQSTWMLTASWSSVVTVVAWRVVSLAIAEAVDMYGYATP